MSFLFVLGRFFVGLFLFSFFFPQTFYKCPILLAYFYQGYDFCIFLGLGSGGENLAVWRGGGDMGGTWGDGDNKIHYHRSSHFNCKLFTCISTIAN